MTEELGSSLYGGEYDRLFPRPPPALDSLQPISRRHSHASPQPYSNPKYRHVPRIAAVRRVLYQPKGPIVPQIYDALATNPDDPSIVRYAPTTNEIVAASPARIIAQITSETFLDYELLSDFFLTVRAYLSTQDLLSYLVARFEWAINRFDDNGRVIRVRAFAALRHWILNYFAYDFVMDRDLRVTFCDRLNALTRIVRARATYGASDMKLIYDLKKCWNGRCILYWDNADAGTEAQKDSDIKPGGIVGSRDSQLSHPSQLLQGAAATDFASSSAEAGCGPSQVLYYNTVPPTGETQMYGHLRQDSAATTRSLPTSPGSEQSVPVLSCSFSTKGFKKTGPYSNRAIGIHPVPTTPEGRRVCPAAPSALANEKAQRPATAHRRSGSFSDAARDKREPLSSDRNAGSEEFMQLAQPYAGSLIRGVIVSPGDPFVNVFAPTTPSVELPEMNLSSQSLGTGVHSGRKLAAQANPTVKHLFGNIRRALSSKNNNSNQNLSFGGSGSFGGSAISGNSFPVGKNPAIPMTVMYDAASVAQAGSIRSNARVDILAAEIAEAFNQAMMAHPDKDVQRLSSIGLAYGNELEQPSPDERPSHNSSPTPSGSLVPPEMRRMDSGVTSGSQSIVIVDDTGLNVPDMPPIPRILPGATKPHGMVTMDYQTIPPLPMGSMSHQLPADMDPMDVKQVIADAGLASDLRPIHDHPKPEHQASVSTLRQATSPEKSEPSRPSLGYRGQSFKSTKSGSVSLRRYASFQSTFTKNSPGHSLDMKNAGASIAGSSSIAPNRSPPAHVLRRRPGGDLRANHNVHDLEEIARPRSTGSITTYSDSMRGSELFTAGRATRTATTRISSSQAPEPAQTLMPEYTGTEAKKTLSYVRTHSSQPALRRPSFEAAVAQFAAIPDDEEGGLEATLLKLEGRYQKSPVQSPVPRTTPQTVESRHTTPLADYAEGPQTADQSDRLQHLETDSVVTLSSLPRSPEPQESTHIHHTAASDNQRHLPLDGTRPTIASTVYAESEESYNSTPLLDRGADPRQGSLALPVPYTKSYDNSQLSPSEAGFDTVSMGRLKHGSSAPTATTDSFLLDEDDDFLSDLSSELSQDFLDHDHPGEQWSTPQGQKENTVLVGDHPPSPPMTMENALSITSQANQAQERRKPPTPDPSPVSQHVEAHIPYGSIGTQQVTKMPSALFSKSRHMPFILGFDSEVLAQQFTIIEKDALSEIDWRDLVDMRWQNTAPSVTNWVEYLRTQDPQGIDLVTARFNLMVKWALSEIILTQNVEERALSIMKYIHIAQQSRKIHNYATLLQLTIALTSTDCTRLTKTWELVPLAEKKILHELEDLVTPIRNFQNLRQEMEKANAEHGVIPFVGRLNSHCTAKQLD